MCAIILNINAEHQTFSQPLHWWNLIAKPTEYLASGQCTCMCVLSLLVEGQVICTETLEVVWDNFRIHGMQPRALLTEEHYLDLALSGKTCFPIDAYHP